MNWQNYLFKFFNYSQNKKLKDTFSNIRQGAVNLWNDITGRTQNEISQKNFNLQQEQFDYQKQLNQLQMEREDTAYQRAVQDARQAGLSALSVSGGATAGSMSSAPAPQMEDSSSGFMQGLNAMQVLSNFVLNARQAMLTADLTQAQINAQNARANLQNTQAFDLNSKNPLTLSILDEQLKDLKRKGSFADWSNDLDRVLYRMNAIDKMNKFSFNQEFGLFDGMSDTDKILNLKHRGNNNAVYPYFKLDIPHSKNSYDIRQNLENDSINSIFRFYPTGSQSSDFASNLVDMNALALSRIGPFMDLILKLVK